MADIIPLYRHILNGSKDVDFERANGYPGLGPLEQRVAIEFATSGHTLKQIAADLNQPLKEVTAAFNNPVTRALIRDIQEEFTKHKIINAAWVEQQVLELWPKFKGEEPVPLVGRDGESYERCKFHSAELTSILKHFGGNEDQKKAGGVKVVINFGDMGVGPKPVIDVDVTDVGENEDGAD